MEKWKKGTGTEDWGDLLRHPGAPQITPRSLPLSPTAGLRNQVMYYDSWYETKMKNE